MLSFLSIGTIQPTTRMKRKADEAKSKITKIITTNYTVSIDNEELRKWRTEIHQLKTENSRLKVENSQSEEKITQLKKGNSSIEILHFCIERRTSQC